MRKVMMYLLAAVGVLCVAVLGFWLYIRLTLETVPYEVVRASDTMEIRQYPPTIMAQVKRAGTRDSALRAGFSPLAGYIFAKERPGDKIAMTAPVVQANDGEAWQVGFIMPASYDIDSLPEPVRDDVTLVPVPAQKRAAIRFAGNPDDSDFAAKEGVLRAWLAAENIEAGKATYAYYDDPMTPGFLRRNEVLLDLDP